MRAVGEDDGALRGGGRQQQRRAVRLRRGVEGARLDVRRRDGLRAFVRARVVLLAMAARTSPSVTGGLRAELAGGGDAGECISGSCKTRIGATRARPTSHDYS